MERKTVYIAGLGLIGASLALGIRRDHPDVEILGYNRSEESRRVALERGMVDLVTDDFAAFAPLADVIILAVPIKQTIAFIKDLAELDLKENVIIGKIIPAGTGMARYRNLEPQAINEVEIIEEVPLTDGTVDEVQTAEVVEE